MIFGGSNPHRGSRHFKWPRDKNSRSFLAENFFLHNGQFISDIFVFVDIFGTSLDPSLAQIWLWGIIFWGGVSPKFSSLWAGALGGLQTAHCWKWNLEGLWHFSPDSLIDWTFSLILLNTQFSFWQFLFAQMVLHFIFFFISQKCERGYWTQPGQYARNHTIADNWWVFESSSGGVFQRVRRIVMLRWECTMHNVDVSLPTSFFLQKNCGKIEAVVGIRTLRWRGLRKT